MVGIIQCSRIYCKRMSSKGLTSIGRRVDDAWRRKKKLHKTWTAHGNALTARGGAWQLQNYCRSLRQSVKDPGGTYFTQIGRSVASDS
jgi:hypothetical protein